MMQRKVSRAFLSVLFPPFLVMLYRGDSAIQYPQKSRTTSTMTHLSGEPPTFDLRSLMRQIVGQLNALNSTECPSTVPFGFPYQYLFVDSMEVITRSVVMRTIPIVLH